MVRTNHVKGGIRDAVARPDPTAVARRGPARLGTGSVGGAAYAPAVAEPESKGVLFPQELPTMARYHPRPGAEHLVRHFWVPEWALPEGVVSRQVVLGYPASSLVVQPGGVTLSGPRRRVSHQDLHGVGWAVGAQLRPAGVAALGVDPASVVDREVPWTAAGLHARVAGAMADAAAESPDRHQRAVEAVTAWLLGLPAPGPEALEANAIAEAVERDPGITTLAALADAVHLSRRTVQRRTAAYVGMSPIAMIRRHRLQEAATRIRRRPETPLVTVAHDIGYADQAHFTRDFRAVVGTPPGDYRARHLRQPQPGP
ncbi:helix-turn-helix domain-containing protein [Phycicoccus ginsengisoli]